MTIRVYDTAGIDQSGLVSVSTTVIADNAVTNAKLRDSVALSVIGRSANSTGDPADIAATAATDQVLRESGSVLGFGTVATAGIADNAVTNAKIRDSAALSVIGRSANSIGDPADIAAVAAAGSVLRESASVIGFGTVATAGIADDAITNLKIRNSAALSVVGRSANSVGDPADIAATAATDQVLRESGSVLGFGTVATAGIANDAVTDTKIRNSGALSVIGRSANSSGDPADVSAVAASGSVLRESGSVLGFGTIATAGHADDSVTFTKMQNVTTDRLIGRDTAGTGDPEEISLNATLEFTGAQAIQRAALSGDVTAPAGSNATTIAADAVTDTKLRNSSALSVIGRSANSSGDPADISTTNASNAVLRENGGVLGFGTIVGRAVTFHGASVYASAPQTITNNTYTSISFDLEYHDTSAFHDTVTNNSRLTIPAGYTGYYTLKTHFYWDASTTGVRFVRFWKNGSTILDEMNFSNDISESLHITPSPMTVLLAAGDYVEVSVKQTSGGDLNLFAYFFQCDLVGV